MPPALGVASRSPDVSIERNQPVVQTLPATQVKKQDYKGFVAGIFSGIAKLSGTNFLHLNAIFSHSTQLAIRESLILLRVRETHSFSFDTIKVRLQTSPPSQFKGPISCLLLTLRNEGARGLYKGATPPLVGWMFMDSLMLGSMTLYRRLLLERGFFERHVPALAPGNLPERKLSTVGHSVAGFFAGVTASLLATPVEHIKARLQIQYAADKGARFYAGPIDCTRRIVRSPPLSLLQLHPPGPSPRFLPD